MGVGTAESMSPNSDSGFGQVGLNAQLPWSQSAAATAETEFHFPKRMRSR